MRSLQLVFVLLFIFISGRVDSAAPASCYTFDTSDDDWRHSGDFYWKWSGDETPDVSDIPSFYFVSEYMWFQDQDLPPVSGSIISPDTFTLDIGDTVQSTVFRRIILGKENDTSRPIVRFVTGSTTQNVLYSYDYEFWSPVSVTCTEGPPSWEDKIAVCCDTYPCTGYFEVDGQIMIVDELLAIDDIGVNSGCGNTPPPPPPPTTHAPPPPPPPTTHAPPPPPTTQAPYPPEWCCNFNDANVCDWSPSYLTDGWIWSGDFTDSIPASPTNTKFIYTIDTSDDAISPVIPQVDSSTTFSFNYYLTTSENIPPTNGIQVFFDVDGYVTAFTNNLPTTGTSWKKVTFTCDTCCGGASSCSGRFNVRTFNKVGEALNAAIDDFSVNGVVC